MPGALGLPASRMAVSRRSGSVSSTASVGGLTAEGAGCEDTAAEHCSSCHLGPVACDVPLSSDFVTDGLT